MATLPTKLSVVSYAVNGSGLGHLSRMVAINRWVRRYCTFAGVRSQHWFLTTSEADTLLFHEGFAGFKLPSKSIIEEAGVPKLAYLALAKQWVWHSLGLLRPDLFLVDTFPNGSFNELLGALDLATKKALVMRPVKDSFVDSSFQAMVGLYDRVVVPEHRDAHPHLAEQLGVRPERLAFSGPVMRTERFELLPRDAARRALGVDDNAFCLLVSGGGGGDASVASLFARVHALVAHDRRVHLVFAAGPLYRGAALRGPRITWWSTPDLPIHMRGLDAAVCAAGFNAVHELAFAGVPSVFVPQHKVADDQHARVAAFVREGACLMATLDDDSLERAIDVLRDAARARVIAHEAAAHVPHNHARDAALEVLSLSLPRSVLEQAHRVLDDTWFPAAVATHASLEEVVDLAASLHEGAIDLDRASLELDAALGLARAAQRVSAPLTVTRKLAALFARRVRTPHATVDDVTEAVCALLEHPCALGQWSSLCMLVQNLGPERVASPQALATLIGRLLDAGAREGLDAFALARLLLDDGAVDDTSNLARLSRLQSRLGASLAAGTRA